MLREQKEQSLGEQSLNPSSNAMGRLGAGGEGGGGPAPLVGTFIPSWEHPSAHIPGGSMGKVRLCLKGKSKRNKFETKLIKRLLDSGAGSHSISTSARCRGNV